MLPFGNTRSQPHLWGTSRIRQNRRANCDL